MAEPLYTCSKQEAMRDSKLDKWRQSHRANVKCAHDIESLIAAHTKDKKLDPETAQLALKRWGFLRVQYVLANTLNRTGTFGFEPDSLRWAQSVFVPYDKDNGAFRVQVNRFLLAQFVQQTYAEYQTLGLFGAEHCAPGHLDYTEKVLILRPNVLKEEYWSAQNQLWYVIWTTSVQSPYLQGLCTFW